jgi:hypothetical protein
MQPTRNTLSENIQAQSIELLTRSRSIVTKSGATTAVPDSA